MAAAPLAAGHRLTAVPGLRAHGVTTLDLLAAPSHTRLVLTGTRENPHAVSEAVRRLARFSDMVQVVTISGADGSRGPSAVADPAYARTGGTRLSPERFCWSAPKVTSRAGPRWTVRTFPSDTSND